MNPLGLATCRGCGARKARGDGTGARQVDQVDGDLHEIDKDSLRKAKKLEEWQASSVDELVDIGKRRGYEHPEKWAAHMWTARQRRNGAHEHARKQQMDFYERLAVEGMLR